MTIFRARGSFRRNRARLSRRLDAVHPQFEQLEPRQLLACALPTGAESFLCLVTGGELADGEVSLEYLPATGALSVRADSHKLQSIDVRSSRGLFAYPNGTPWASEFDIHTANTMVKTAGSFTDIVAMAVLPRNLSEYELLKDLALRIVRSDQAPQARVSLIYPRTPDSGEPADSPDGAMELITSRPMVRDRSLDRAEDEDWFRWTAPQRGRLSVELFFEHETGDAELELYNQRGVLLKWSSTANRNESIQFEVLAGEQYLIRIFGFSGQRQSRYDLVAYLVPEESPVYVLTRTALQDQLLALHPLTLKQIGQPINLAAALGRGGQRPTDVELGQNGLIYLSLDGLVGGDSIAELTPDGVLVREFALPPDPGPLAYPAGFDVLEDGTFLIPQPNQARVVQMSRQGVIEQIFAAPAGVDDATVVIGPAVGSTVQRPISTVGTGTARNRLSPTAFGQYWEADQATDRLRLFDSLGRERIDRQISADAPRDVQEGADRSLYYLDENSGTGFDLTRRETLPEPLLAAGLFDDLAGISNGRFALTNSGGSKPTVQGGSNGFVRLANLSANDNNSIAYDELTSQTGPAPGGIILAFDFRMSNDADSVAAGGAAGTAGDGLGIGLFATSRYGTSGGVNPTVMNVGSKDWERPSFLDAFTIGLDVNPKVDILSVNWNGVQAIQQDLTGKVDLNDNQFHETMIQLLPDGTSTRINVWIDGQQVISRGSVAGLDLAKLPRYRLIAGGSTSNSFLRADLDNLSLSSGGVFEDFSGPQTVGYTFQNGSGDVPTISTARGESFVRLTTLTANNNSSIALHERPLQSGPSRDGLMMSFDFRMSDDAANDRAGGCCGSAADGLGVGLFSTDVYGHSGGIDPTALNAGVVWERPAFRDAFTIGLDVFRNIDVLSVNWNGTQILERELRGSVDLNDNRFHQVTTRLTPKGTSAVIDVWIDGHSVVQGGVISGLDLANLPGYRLIAGGRTGSAFLTADVDNLSVASFGIRSSSETTSALTANAPFSYAWVSNSTASSSVPSAVYSHNESGGDITVSRSQVGRYSVDFAGLAPAGSGGHVQVTAYGANSNYCHVQSWGVGAARGVFRANVSCFDRTGAPADSQFNVAVIHPDNLGGIAYAYADAPATQSYTANPLYAHNPSGDVRLSRTAVGRYSARFVGLASDGQDGGTVQVTSSGSTSNRCTVSGWGRQGADLVANVACANTAGAARDTAFVIAVIPKSSSPDNLGYAWTSQASASQPLNGIYTHNPFAGVIQKTRTSEGQYSVAFEQLNQARTSGGNVLVTAYGTSGNHCKVVSWTGTTDNMTARVNCHDSAGALADTPFTILTVPTPMPATDLSDRLITTLRVNALPVPGEAIALAVSDGEFPVALPGDLLDRDGDGLPDVWETNGIDVNGDGTIDLNLAALGASPNHKDLFLEIDAVAGFAPSAAALERVRAAFAAVPSSLIYNPDGRDGINLHVFLDDTVPATRANRQLPGNYRGAWAAFKKIRKEFFGTNLQRNSVNAKNILTARDMVFRYALFGDQRGTQGHAGLAEQPGRNLMVTLGGWNTPGGTDEQQAAMLMHELGHTLGLAHGGDDDIQFKPNYLSVMNYSHSDGATLLNGTPFLDYSRFAPNSSDSDSHNHSLDERQLAEANGLAFPSGVDFTFQLGYDQFAVSGGPVDWNGNGSSQETVSADLTHKRSGELLKSYNDWGNLIFEFRNYHSDSDGEGFDREPEEGEPTSDICTQYHSEHRPSGADAYECNEIPDDAKSLPDEDEMTIDGPDDEDWFFLDLNLFDILAMTVAPIETETDPPDVLLTFAEVLADGSVAVLAQTTSTQGAATTFAMTASHPGRFYVQVQGANDAVHFENYHLTKTVMTDVETYHWNGSQSTSWALPGNWDEGAVPAIGSDLVFPANAVRRAIDLDGSRLVNSLQFDASYQLLAGGAESLSIVQGVIDVALGAVVTLDTGLLITGSVSQQGPGQVLLNGTAETWTVQDGSILSGSGTVSALIVKAGATFSAGDGVGVFHVTDELDLQGTLSIDVLPHRDVVAEVDAIQAARVVLASTSVLAFAVSVDPADSPDGLNPLVLGDYLRTLIASTELVGNFGQSPLPDTHLNNGVFLRSLAVGVAGPTVNVSLFQAVPGDSNGLDGFTTSDLVQVFASNEYEDNLVQNSTWETGDWNHDGEFSSADLIAAFQAGYYELP